MGYTLSISLGSVDFFFFKQKTAYEMRISDWSSDVCSSDLERSHWHRVDAAEAWHWYAGAPLRLMVSADGRTAAEHRMGPDIAGGERPQAVVPAKAWQAAESLGAWTLCGCKIGRAHV